MTSLGWDSCIEQAAMAGYARFCNPREEAFFPVLVTLVVMINDAK
jgi:hypothetical protein